MGPPRRDRPAGCGRRCRRSTRRISTFITDLSQRGLLDRTLVMVSSEFGRSPKINKDAGRDHWPKVFSVVLAGGGVKKGYIHGASNSTATEPERDPDRPRGPGHHGLPPARHRRRQGADGPRQPADRDRRRRQGPDRAARVRWIGSAARRDDSPGRDRRSPRHDRDPTVTATDSSPSPLAAPDAVVVRPWIPPRRRRGPG